MKKNMNKFIMNDTYDQLEFSYSVSFDSIQNKIQLNGNYIHFIIEYSNDNDLLFTRKNEKDFLFFSTSDLMHFLMLFLLNKFF